jgi:NTP pyrophosphatase (non-canonical NTP hydrolase)
MQLEDIAAKIRVFRDERDWAQFHNPKDMAIAISIEASELLEHFLWKDAQQVQLRVEAKKQEIEAEIADIGIYLTELADLLGIDLLAAMERRCRRSDGRPPRSWRTSWDRRWPHRLTGPIPPFICSP